MSGGSRPVAPFPMWRGGTRLPLAHDYYSSLAVARGCLCGFRHAVALMSPPEQLTPACAWAVRLRKSRRVENTNVGAGADSVLWSLRFPEGTCRTMRQGCGAVHDVPLRGIADSTKRSLRQPRHVQGLQEPRCIKSGDPHRMLDLERRGAGGCRSFTRYRRGWRRCWLFMAAWASAPCRFWTPRSSPFRV